jgi:hypothetical protein
MTYARLETWYFTTYYMQLIFSIYMMGFLMWLILKFTTEKKASRMDEALGREVPYTVFWKNQ